MTSRVVMPIAAYKVLRFMCRVGSVEHRLLKTAFLVHDNGREIVALYCDDTDAQSLIDFASRRCPEVVSKIKLTPNPLH
jgi:hypothetical protein